MHALRKNHLLAVCLLCSVAAASAQQTQSANSVTAVPRLVHFAGSFRPPAGQPAGMTGATFAIYSEQEGGTPLWTEDQNVELDANGNYTALLGVTKNGGVPPELFAGGEARWLQVKFYAPGEVDLPRVLLVSVPYALKAADSDTLGGKPASAYLLAGSSTSVYPFGAAPPAQTSADVAPSTTGPNNIARFINTSGGLGNSSIVQSGSNVGIGTRTPAATLEVNGNAQVDGNLTLSGSASVTAVEPLIYAVGPLEGGSFSAGFGALPNIVGSPDNTAIGSSALFGNTTGADNTAVGVNALGENTTGSDNTTIGLNSLLFNTTGSNNTASGYDALENTTGSNNIAIGSEAGINIAATNNNIDIGNQAVAGDSGAIRIGTAGSQTTAFMAGIYGVNTSGIPVYINSNGQLGTVSSSRRYKEDIQDMADASSGLLRLRPVTFRYKKPFADGSKPVEYGLIAEEVAEVYPDMVARSADGQIETVKYQILAPMLLNELQKQNTTIAVQKEQIGAQQHQIRSLEERLAKVEAALEGTAITAASR